MIFRSPFCRSFSWRISVENNCRKMTSLVAALSLLLVCQLLVPPGTEASVADTLGKILPKVARLSLPAGYVAHPDIGVAYKVNEGFLTWNEAKDGCISDGANLAVIDSEKKLEYALQTPQDIGVRHVGIHYVNDNWVSATNGAILSNVPWKDANERLVGFTNRRCSMIDWKVATRGSRIISAQCDTHGDYICEIPIPSATA